MGDGRYALSRIPKFRNHRNCRNYRVSLLLSGQEDIIMRKFLTVILATCLFGPVALANNGKEPGKNPPGPTTSNNPRETQNVETENRKTLTVKGGGLLNTETTPEQARKAAEATNRQILLQQQQHRTNR
jgi:hypothetical protein